ncbi:unnamed protein product [Rotaria sp. Silwood2]|nr:unnamed protein product [Rotaria sp. Silwood2]CAF4354564.1 unnamed protein product [Rotaria sp. Silwood2]
MATAAAFSNVDDYECCVLCSSKYNRNRPSFCQCKHCSIPLCLDCMKEHHDEVLQDVAQISHQYNELQELIRTKQKMIVDETNKSIEDVNEYFKTYINELLEIQQRINLDIEIAKQDAQNNLLKIDSDLLKLGIEIQGLTKENIAQTIKMKNLLTNLKSIEKSVITYQIIKTENLLKTKPDFSVKFDCSTVISGCTAQSLPIETKEMSLIKSKELSSEISPLNMSPQSATQQKLVDQHEKVNIPHNYNCYYAIPHNHRQTTYIIDRMASDGENIMYTSYCEEESDLIAYSRMDNIDKYREWNQSRISDMIWWSSIAKFICATEEGIFTVNYINEKLRILSVIRDKWSYVRAAANTDYLFI